MLCLISPSFIFLIGNLSISLFSRTEDYSILKFFLLTFSWCMNEAFSLLDLLIKEFSLWLFEILLLQSISLVFSPCAGHW